MQLIVVAAAYFGAAKLGLALAFVADQVSPVWPPTGIALAAVLLLGRRVWPAVFLGALVANATAHEPLATAVGIATGNTLEALAGAWLLRRIGVRVGLDRPRDALALVGGAAVLSPMVAATVGVASLCLGGVQPWRQFGSLWWLWWMGDALGDLVVAPLILVWGSAAAFDHRRLPEAIALLAAVAGLTLTIFAGRLGMPATGYPLHYMIFPLVVWAALRFGQHGTTAVTFCTAVVAIWSTVHGWGPFVAATPNQSLVLLQLFMAVVAVTALPFGAAIVERNRTEERRAEDYARVGTSEERLRLALEAGRMGVWDWTIATGAVTWSEHLEQIHGLPPGSFPGTFEGFLSIVHPEDRERVQQAIAQSLASGRGYDIEFRSLRPDGSVHWMATKGAVVHDVHGRALRMIGVSMDVTGRRQLEEDVRARVQQLADAGREKDQFLAMLAHELRNPLAPLATALHLLDRGDGDQTQAIEIARRQTAQLARLVDDLLDVSRITQGKIALRKEIVALADVVARAVETIRPQVDGRKQSLAVELPVEPIHLAADPTRVAQVLANLLGNASKYTGTGGRIRLQATLDHSEVAISVRDTGVGIPRELLPHVFDLFVQGDTSLDRQRGGLGIGLTIVHRLVDLHGGRVAAYSDGPGSGSEFVVRLPVTSETPVEPDRRSTANGPVRRLDVLVVEDNEDAAESLAALLDAWGHEVRVVHTADAAIAAVEERRPDLVLSDVGLPDMDGYALARRLRAVHGDAVPLLVALSGYGRDEDRRQARDAGFDHHLVKPADADDLAAVLARAG